MKLTYDLIKNDYLRGLRLNERRVKGGGAFLRLLVRVIFLIPVIFSALTLFMLAFLALTGNWEEDFTGLAGPLAVMLLAGLMVQWVFSSRFRAMTGIRRIGKGFWGPHTLSLTPSHVRVLHGENGTEIAYPELTEVWEKKDYCFLYCKMGLWYMLPPCAFESGERRREFLAMLRAAMAGEAPAESGGAELPPLPEADVTLSFTWQAEELRQSLTRANLRYARTKLYWRPARVVSMALGLAVMVLGALLLADGELVGAGILLIGAAAGLVPPLALFPPMVHRLVDGQMRRGELNGRSDGVQTVLFWKEGLIELHGGGRESVLWSQVAEVLSGEDGLCLFQRDNRFHVFPPQAFRGREEQERTAEYVRTHMGQ